MPYGDGTGPYGDPNWPCRRRGGIGAGRFYGRGRRFLPIVPVNEKDALEQEKELLKKEVEAIEKKLKELESNK